MKTQKPQTAPPDILAQCAEIVRAVGVNETIRRSGVPHSTVHRLLAGTHPPSLETVTRVLAACGYRLLIVPDEGPKE